MPKKQIGHGQGSSRPQTNPNLDIVLKVLKNIKEINSILEANKINAISLQELVEGYNKDRNYINNLIKQVKANDERSVMDKIGDINSLLMKFEKINIAAEDLANKQSTGGKTRKHRTVKK